MRVGLVTCRTLTEPDPDALLLLAGCHQAKLDATFVAWDDPSIDWGVYDVLVLRSCWNYYENPGAFLDWLQRIEDSTKVWNSPEIIRWNIDKKYLNDLYERGIPVVPTEYIEQGQIVNLQTVCEKRGWTKIVVKPTISAGSWNTRVFESGSDQSAREFLIALYSDRGAMIQPYLESVISVGERSVISIGGKATHVVIKRPRLAGADESVSEAVEPTFAEQVLLTRCLEPIADQILYARLDLIQDNAGDWIVSELELIEPSLYFLQSPQALQAFVTKLLEVAQSTTLV